MGPRVRWNHEVHTRNLDKLMQRGTMLENFFCASPVCFPARASILIGRFHPCIVWCARLGPAWEYQYQRAERADAFKSTAPAGDIR